MNRHFLGLVALALISFVGTISSCLEYRTASLLTKAGVPADGVVVEREWVGGKSTSYFLTVRLSGSGVQPHMQSRIQVSQGLFNAYSEGSPVKMLVDPRPGEKSMIVAGHPGSTGRPLFIMLSLGLLCTVSVTVLVTRLRGRTVS